MYWTQHILNSADIELCRYLIIFEKHCRYCCLQILDFADIELCRSSPLKTLNSVDIQSCRYWTLKDIEIWLKLSRYFSLQILMDIELCIYWNWGHYYGAWSELFQSYQSNQSTQSTQSSKSSILFSHLRHHIHRVQLR